MIHNIKYTLDTLPEVINYNQFYCYRISNGEISIGTILGESAIRKGEIFYEINGVKFTDLAKFSEQFPVLKLKESRYKKSYLMCFQDYDEFVKDYKSRFLPQKTKENNKSRYIVHKENYSCRKTKARSTPYGWKEFNTKDEALEFSLKGLEKNKKQLTSLMEELNSLKKQFEAVQLPETAKIDFETIVAKPIYLKENDVLKKVSYQHYDTLHIETVEDDSAIVVKEFITPGLVRLSNGEILSMSECSSRPPFFVRYNDAEALKNYYKLMIKQRCIANIGYNQKTLEVAQKSLNTYVPLKTAFDCCFHKGYITKLLNDYKQILKTL